MGLSACHQEQPQMQMPPPAVTVAHPVKQKITEWDEFTGRLDAAESVNLYSQVTGYLKEVTFKDGADVQKGDLLFLIDPRPFQAVLDQANGQLESARVRLEQTARDVERAATLKDTKAMSEEDFDKRNNEKLDAKARLLVAKATVDAAQLNVEYCQIKAPITGRIGRRLMDVGNLVIGGPMGATNLGSIVTLDPIYCYIDADELSVLKYQRSNREGKRENARENHIPCEMALADEKDFPHKGEIDFVDNRLNPNTGTMLARAVFTNTMPERGQRVLQPGYFARVRVPASGEEDAILIDDRAVGADQSQKLVFVVDEKNIVQQRPVSVGPVINGLRIIRKGLDEKDNVIVNGQARIRPGMMVKVMTVEEAAKAARAPSEAAQH